MVTKRLLLRAVLKVLPIIENEFLSQKHFTSYGKIYGDISIQFRHNERDRNTNNVNTFLYRMEMYDSFIRKKFKK